MKRTKQADGGRVGAKTGGLMALLKAMGMKAPDKIADKKQIENVIRDQKQNLKEDLKMTCNRHTSHSKKSTNH